MKYSGWARSRRLSGLLHGWLGTTGELSYAARRKLPGVAPPIFIR